jgi:hypothetical protein
MKVMEYRPAQKGKALGTSGFITDWPFAHCNPADSAALQLAQDGQQERGNHPVLFAVRRGVGASQCTNPGGWDGPESERPW